MMLPLFGGREKVAAAVYGTALVRPVLRATPEWDGTVADAVAPAKATANTATVPNAGRRSRRGVVRGIRHPYHRAAPGVLDSDRNQTTDRQVASRPTAPVRLMNSTAGA